MSEDGERLPNWLKNRGGKSGSTHDLKKFFRSKRLRTVCESARCPNMAECFQRQTATFMILGDVCTRNCTFCAVQSGNPGPPDPSEPLNVASAVSDMGLDYIVITSVTRDDLEDGGSGQFAKTVRRLKDLVPHARIEVLTPDFGGSFNAVKEVILAGPHVYNHNLETVKRLYDAVRPGADYRRSLAVLKAVKSIDGSVFSKSGIMVGLGETVDEVLELMYDLREAGCDMLTIGQYLRPSMAHRPINEYIAPSLFETYEKEGKKAGFMSVFSGPLVRSSYHARDFGRRVGVCRNFHE